MDDLNFNIFNIVIFSGIIQGLIFSFVIFFHKKYKSKTNNFIALTALVLSLSNLQYWFMDIGLKGFFQIFSDFRIPCDLLIVPSFFLFVYSYLQKVISNRIILFLAIPFIFSTIFGLVIFKSSFISNETYITINIAFEIFSLLFNLILIILIFNKIIKHERLFEDYKVNIQTKWLKQILIIGGIMCLFWIIETMYVKRENNIGLSVYYPLWISISFLIYWISYVGVFHSKLYNERNINKKFK